jgi:hypothetical protein
MRIDRKTKGNRKWQSTTNLQVVRYKLDEKRWPLPVLPVCEYDIPDDSSVLSIWVRLIRWTVTISSATSVTVNEYDHGNVAISGATSVTEYDLDYRNSDHFQRHQCNWVRPRQRTVTISTEKLPPTLKSSIHRQQKPIHVRKLAVAW